MRKRTFACGLVAGAIIASSTTAFAADFIQAALYPIKLVINGQEQKIPEEYSILNYNGHTYVPLRLITENVGGKVGFKEGATYEDTTVTIELNQPGSSQESNNALTINDTFLSTAQQGTLNGISIPLGTSKQQLLNILGKPDETGELHSPFLKYGNTTFYLVNDAVNVIEVKVDLSIKQLKNVLGKPELDGLSDAGTTEYVVGYNVEPYYLYFKYNSTEAETGTLLFKNPKG